jgi:hypothetical protein
LETGQLRPVVKSIRDGAVLSWARILGKVRARARRWRLVEVQEAKIEGRTQAVWSMYRRNRDLAQWFAGGSWPVVLLSCWDCAHRRRLLLGRLPSRAVLMEACVV